MKRVRISIQIALSLAILSITVMLVAKGLGLLPDGRRTELSSRIALCEQLAVTSSLLTNRQRWDDIEVCLRELKARNGKVLSAGLRRHDGRLLAQTKEHEGIWRDSPDHRSTETQVYVPILQGQRQWGSLEVAFQPIGTPGWPSWLDPSEMRLLAFVAAASGLLYMVYLTKVLCDLDPSRTMPQRVRSALDALTEGLLVLDNNGRIVMANQAFAQALGGTPESLLGKKASSLPWKPARPDHPLPWESAQRRIVAGGVEMGLKDDVKDGRTFLVNAAPIEDQRGVARGVLASFADITQLEQKKQELLKMLEALRESRDKIRQQNDELAFLATRDPLTGCLNRRAFFEQFEAQWRGAQASGGELCCVMVDVDHFKSINDRFGHSRGDEVLRDVARELQRWFGAEALVCRYGGEEFCILLPLCGLNRATEIAETLRERVSSLEFTEFRVTASFGLAGTGASSCQQLLDQADKSLYYAKHSGRDRVIRWDQVPANFSFENLNAERPHATARLDSRVSAEPHERGVPYHAVASLVCALAYRDPETACHSSRVADLAVATARGLMSAGEAYILEIAALLHDIGKIGVPDSILLKPGPLTPEEWEIMQLHGRIGVEIVNASFHCRMLVDIVRLHHAKFGGSNKDHGMPSGHDIPLGARIVSIADAYDAMVSDRVYRKGRSPEEAFAELRRMAGLQFDPQLVERFIEVVRQRSSAEPVSMGAVTKELALHLGLQTERLATALDNNDFTTIRAIATHLSGTANAHGLESLVKAAELLKSSDEDTDLTQMVTVIHEIIDLSLAAQQTCLKINCDMAQVSLARRQSVAVEVPDASGLAAT